MSRLVGLYPRTWRARYGDEFAELLAARPPSLRDRLDIVIGALDARMNPQVPGVGERERAVGGDRVARGLAVVTGVLLTIWSVVVATAMVPWESNLVPQASAELMNLGYVSGTLGSLLTPVVLGIVVVRYGRVLGETGVTGAVLLPIGLVASALGLGILALLALAIGAILFSMRANGRILGAPIALAFAAGHLAIMASFVAFAGGGGQDVNLLLPVLALGPSWILFGIGLRQPRAVPDPGLPPATQLSGA
jgi:hypothetical protein